MQVDVYNDLLYILLLYSLPKEYAVFRCAVETRDEFLRVTIIEESEARRLSSGASSSEAMLASQKQYWRKDSNSDCGDVK